MAEDHLARAFMRDAQVIILDEPTAALDAQAEHDLFAGIMPLTRGKMALYISHRFWSGCAWPTGFCSLRTSHLVSKGTHEELMALSTTPSCDLPGGDMTSGHHHFPDCYTLPAL